MKTTGGPPHVAMLATPGMGHIIPLAELAKLLASRHGATATLITFTSTASSAAQRALLASLPPAVASLSLPPVDLSDLPRDAAIETLMSEECARSLPALARVLSGLAATTRLVAFVADQFGTESLAAVPPRDATAGVSARAVARCLFVPMNLHALSLVLHLPDLAASVAGEFRDMPSPLRLPGCVPIPGSDVPSPLQDRLSPAYAAMVRLAERYRDADAILVNSFDAVEPDVAAVLRRPPEPGDRRWPPVYPIGPLIRHQFSEADAAAAAALPPSSPPRRAACLEWLDRQPARSVIFVSFGSAGALRKDEMRELALGLERSGQRFLWVLRSPIDGEGGGAGGGTRLSDSYYGVESKKKKDPFVYLPEGFVERTKGVGLLVPSWAPQTEVLAHGATGAFLTHCGWNSTLESLVHGVPMVAWPLFAEQRLNAVVLAEGVGAAVRLPERKDEESIAAAVREVMAGDGRGAMVRVKVAELRKAAAEGLREGGAAMTALDEVVEKWEAQAN